MHSASTNPKEQLALLLGVSGCGKTRVLYESLCEEYGIIFDCSKSFEASSPDLKEVVDGTKPKDRDTASLYFERAICSRLLLLCSILSLAEENNQSFTPMCWLIFQLKARYKNSGEYQAVMDTFTYTKEEIRLEDCEKIESGIEKSTS
eukprot:gb/GECH01001781.1/.p1 GENE.gb/GECH01001781.1/~~gb/GECH01001781.1/.p1  ORF type:complete len:148 (+),score=19.08 gb/GECH01001781.1/:1-444(+)